MEPIGDGLESFKTDITNSIEEKIRNIFNETTADSEEHTKTFNRTSQNVMLQTSLIVSPLDSFTNIKKEFKDRSKTPSEGSSVFDIDQLKEPIKELKNLNDSINFGSETSFEDIENEVERIAFEKITNVDNIPSNNKKQTSFEKIENEVEIIAFENIEAYVDNDIPSNNKKETSFEKIEKEVERIALGNIAYVDNDIPSNNEKQTSFEDIENNVEMIVFENIEACVDNDTPSNKKKQTSFEEIENEVERIAFENIEDCVDNDIPSTNKMSDIETNLDEKDDKSAKFEHFVNTLKKQGLSPSNFTEVVNARFKLLTKITSNKSKYANPNYARMTTSCEKSVDSISNIKLPEDEPKNEYQYIGDFFKEDKDNEKISSKEFKDTVPNFEKLDDDPFICKSDPFMTSALLKKDLKSPRCDCNELLSEDKILKVRNTTKTQKQTEGELCETKFETADDQVNIHILNDDHSSGRRSCDTKMSATKEGTFADVFVALPPETLSTEKKNFRNVFSGNTSNTKFNNCNKSCDMDLEDDQTLELLPINEHSSEEVLELSAEEKIYLYRYRELNAQPTPYFGSVAVFNMLKKIYSYFNVNNYLTEVLRMVLAVLSVLFILFIGFIFTLCKWSKKYF